MNKNIPIRKFRLPTGGVRKPLPSSSLQWTEARTSLSTTGQKGRRLCLPLSGQGSPQGQRGGTLEMEEMV